MAIIRAKVYDDIPITYHRIQSVASVQVNSKQEPTQVLITVEHYQDSAAREAGHPPVAVGREVINAPCTANLTESYQLLKEQSEWEGSVDA